VNPLGEFPVLLPSDFAPSLLRTPSSLGEHKKLLGISKTDKLSGAFVLCSNGNYVLMVWPTCFEVYSLTVFYFYVEDLHCLLFQCLAGYSFSRIHFVFQGFQFYRWI
jgi:hypothetical protein